MSLKSDVESLKNDNEVMFKKIVSEESKPVKKKFFRIPAKFRSRRKYKEGKVLVVWFGNNHNMEFRWAEIKGGIIKVGDDEYRAYEKGAIYNYKLKYPVCAVFEWRLTPVGGRAEDYKTRVIGGDDDKKTAEDLGLSSFAQQTIVRAMKLVEIEKDEKKKKKMPVIWIIIGIIVLGFIGAKLLGVF